MSFYHTRHQDVNIGVFQNRPAATTSTHRAALRNDCQEVITDKTFQKLFAVSFFSSMVKIIVWLLNSPLIEYVTSIIISINVLFNGFSSFLISWGRLILFTLKKTAMIPKRNFHLSNTVQILYNWNFFYFFSIVFLYLHIWIVQERNVSFSLFLMAVEVPFLMRFSQFYSYFYLPFFFF